MYFSNYFDLYQFLMINKSRRKITCEMQSKGTKNFYFILNLYAEGFEFLTPFILKKEILGKFMWI